VTAPSAPAAALPHLQAARDLLDTQTPSAIRFAVGVAPTGTPPYGVLYVREVTAEGWLGDRYRDLLVEFQVTCVGTGPEQAMDVADRSRAVLLTQTPAVAGRVVQPLWQEPTGEPLLRDDDVTPPLYYLPLIFQMRTEPAP
jgi:hypothetical protein